MAGQAYTYAMNALGLLNERLHMGEHHGEAGRVEGEVRKVLACGVGLFLMTFQTQLLNSSIFPITSLAAPLARELQTAVGIAVGLAALMAALRSPSLVWPDRLVPAMLSCGLVGSLTLCVASASPLGASLCLCVRAVGTSAELYLVGFAFAQISSSRGVALSASASVLVSACVSLVVPSLPYTVALLVDAALTLGCYAVLQRYAVPALRDAASSQATELLALASPRSVLSPANRVFVLMFVFSTASGFGRSLRVAEQAPDANWICLLALAVAVFLFVFAPAQRRHEDQLFTVAALLIVAGFLITPVGGASGPAGAVGPAAANSLLFAGNWCFRILMWISVAAMSARNMAGALTVLACLDTYGGVGTFVGAELGHFCNALLMVHPDAVTLAVGFIVLALFAYVLVGLRDFSFAATIDGIEPTAELPDAAPETPSRSEQIDIACDRLARQGGLTPREREIMGMLARGHNGYHIRDELTLSYNTVKTHVKRIYRKLDVHSQQELIDLVESRCNV